MLQNYNLFFNQQALLYNFSQASYVFNTKKNKKNMNKVTLSIFCICLSLTLSAIGQTNFQQKQENTKAINNKMTEDELKTYYKSIHSRLPLKRENISLKSENDFSKSQKTGLLNSYYNLPLEDR